MSRLRGNVSFIFVVIFCWIVLTGEAQAAGLLDVAAGWLVGLVAGVAATATGYRIVQGRGPSAADPATYPEARPGANPAETGDVYKVWYATNRKMQAGEFAAERSDTLRYGDCQVAIPRSHKFGSIGSSSVVRAFQRWTTGADDALHIVKRSGWAPQNGTDGFVKSIAAAMNKTSNQILVYIHGYNASFDDAIMRAAQIGFDLKVPGITAAFCWPSKGIEAAYMADEETIRLTEPKLAEFLILLKQNFPDYAINILAHSMGNRALTEVLTNLDRYPALSQARFGQIILAAPDIDARYFRQVAAVYPQLSARTTLYVCANDKALDVSTAMHANARLGYCPPVTIFAGIDTVEATNINLNGLGHGYYARAALVLYDMFTLLRENTPPAGRPALSQVRTTDGEVYWQFRSMED